MVRKPTVLTPRAERVTKSKPVAEWPPRQWTPTPGRRYRLRHLEPNPFGDLDATRYSDDSDALLTDAAALPPGAAVVEERCAGAYAPLADSVHDWHRE